MAESTKLTREQLEKIITEELGELDEGFLDRMMAKMSATGAGAKASVGNIAKKVANAGYRALGADADIFQELDPKLVKQMTILTKRMNSAGKQVAKVYNDIWTDYQNLKGAMDDTVAAASAEIIEPVLNQVKEAGGAMVGVGGVFKKAISSKAVKGSARGTETERGMAGGAEPAMAESKKPNRNKKIKIIRANKK